MIDTNTLRLTIQKFFRDARDEHVLRRVFRYRGWMPVALQILLILIFGNYTAARSPAFLSEFNLNSLSLAALPLALVAMAQVNAILMGYLDISVGAIMTICVIVASFIVTTGATPTLIVLGAAAILLTGVLVGLFNAGLIHGVKLPSIIATLATLSILDGISLTLRPIPAGLIDFDVLDLLKTSVGFMPIAFILFFVIAVLWDIWLYRSPGGLTLRAVGYDRRAARRIGAATTRIPVSALLLSGLMAAIASFFLAAQIGVGDPRAGTSFALTSITAAVLGGASLAGGRGTFIGAMVSSLFLTLIVNALPLLGLSSEIGPISIGVLMLAGLILYQVGDLKDLGKRNWKKLRRLMQGGKPPPNTYIQRFIRMTLQHSRQQVKEPY